MIIKLENHGAGRIGDFALARIASLGDDLELVASWRTIGDGDAGDCFFSATQLFALLVEAGQSQGFRLRAGIFAPPDAPEKIVHAWIEFGSTVINCSNIVTLKRPIYARPWKAYQSMNFAEFRFQPVTPNRFKRHYRASGNDVRATAKAVFAIPMNVQSTLEGKRSA